MPEVEDKMEIDKAIEIIEKNTVYRIQALIDDDSAMVTSTNGMPTTRWTKQQLLKVAELSDRR